MSQAFALDELFLRARGESENDVVIVRVRAQDAHHATMRGWDEFFRSKVDFVAQNARQEVENCRDREDVRATNARRER